MELYRGIVRAALEKTPSGYYSGGFGIMKDLVKKLREEQKSQQKTKEAADKEWWAGIKKLPGDSEAKIKWLLTGPGSRGKIGPEDIAKLNPVIRQGIFDALRRYKTGDGVPALDPEISNEEWVDRAGIIIETPKVDEAIEIYKHKNLEPKDLMDIRRKYTMFQRKLIWNYLKEHYPRIMSDLQDKDIKILELK